MWSFYFGFWWFPFPCKIKMSISSFWDKWKFSWAIKRSTEWKKKTVESCHPFLDGIFSRFIWMGFIEKLTSFYYFGFLLWFFGLGVGSNPYSFFGFLILMRFQNSLFSRFYMKIFEKYSNFLNWICLFWYFKDLNVEFSSNLFLVWK